MKLKINNEYQDVGFWSFMKCNFLVQLALTGLLYGLIILLWAIIIPILKQ